MSQWLTVKGLGKIDAIGRWLNEGLQDAVHDPEVMQPLVHWFGRSTGSTAMGAMDWNNTNGPLGSEWQPLSQLTMDRREERGYPREGPVLQQSGQLISVARSPFLRWGRQTRRSTRNVTAPYGNFEPLSMTATVSNGHFHATISGSRVQNQYGGSLKWQGERYGSRDRKRYAALPRRSFWYLDEGQLPTSMRSLGFVLMRKWRDNARGILVV